MSRHRVDTSMQLREEDFQRGDATREIEEPEGDPSSPEPRRVTVRREPYLPSAALVEAVNLAIALGRPLLLQGDPGCGKTRLAYAVAYALSLPLEMCPIKSTSRAQSLLYTYDAVSRLYDAQLGDKGPRVKFDGLRSEDIRNYICLGPLGRAIARAKHGRRSVVLLDEIDKADLDFPNDLLWELDRLEFRIPEVPSMHYAVPDRPELRPITIVTHNDEKALPAPFLRRCIYHYIEINHDEAELRKILAIHDIGDEPLSKKAVEVLVRIRALDLAKRPGISELIDWAGYLGAVKARPEDLERLPYLGVLLKQEEDQQIARKVFAESKVS